jgi:hypothetical protein
LNYKHDHQTSNKENLWRFVRYTGTLYVCDYDNSHHATLAQAIASRDWYESPEGQQDRIQREERRRIQREYDAAREERRARMSAERNEWRLEVCPFFEDGEVQFA